VITVTANRRPSPNRWSPDRTDPTRTGPLRRKMLRELRQRFEAIKHMVVSLVGERDAFGLGDGKTENVDWALRKIRNAGQFEFMSSSDALKAFQRWLKRQLVSEVIGRDEQQLWKRFSEEAWKQGAGRSFDDVRRSALRQEKPELFLPDRQDSLKDFYDGSRDEFLRSAFNRPVAAEKLRQLASRTFEDIKDVSRTMATRMRRVLLDGMAKGEHALDVAERLAEEVDISLAKAETVARTEISRAYVEGQLDSLEMSGVTELGVMVEWSTIGDSHVCELCQPLEGIVLQVDEARGMFPRHPNCRCALIPANVGEEGKGQKKTKRRIEDAIEASVEEEGRSTWRGAGRRIDKNRPEPILD